MSRRKSPPDQIRDLLADLPPAQIRRNITSNCNQLIQRIDGMERGDSIMGNDGKQLALEKIQAEVTGLWTFARQSAAAAKLPTPPIPPE